LIEEEKLSDDDEDQDQDASEEEEVDVDSAATILVFVVRNHRYSEQRVNIKWKQGFRDKVNFRMPAHDTVYKIDGECDKVVLRLAKLRPLEDWGSLRESFEINFEQKVKSYPPLRQSA
jgi:hypothetical protein